MQISYYNGVKHVSVKLRLSKIVRRLFLNCLLRESQGTLQRLLHILSFGWHFKHSSSEGPTQVLHN